MIRPPALPDGARISLVAPAGPLPDGAIDRAVERIRRWGWDPLLAENAAGRHGYLSAPDEVRAADLNAALRDRENDAIWFLRGGYGTMRILQQIDWRALLERPRPVIGFSDATAVHLALQRQGLVSFHGPHPAVEELPPYAETGIRRMLTEREPLGPIPFPPGMAVRAETVAGGVAEGALIGGNLSLLAAMVGTPYAPRARGAILFIEEVGEPAYRMDRLLSQLLLAGTLHEVAGIAVGAMSDSPDPPGKGIPLPAELLLDRLGGLGVPVAYGFPFGHVPNNWTLPVGVRSRLDAGAGVLEILEPAVA